MVATNPTAVRLAQRSRLFTMRTVSHTQNPAKEAPRNAGRRIMPRCYRGLNVTGRPDCSSGFFHESYNLGRRCDSWQPLNRRLDKEVPTIETELFHADADFGKP